MDGLLEAIKQWVAGFETSLEAYKVSLERSLARAENAMVRRILADILPVIQTERGLFRPTVSNLAKANLIEAVFDRMGEEELRPILDGYAEQLLGVAGRNAEYYILTGQDAAKVALIAKDLDRIRAIVGLDATGGLLPDGYLFRLGRSEAIRERLKQYLLTSIASGQSTKQFSDGLRSLITGTGGVDGALVGYWRQYAYDTHSRVREINNKHFAEELGLRWFVYQGGLITTSRAFCIKKNGRVFSEQEALLDWPNDPDLIDKAHRAAYRPLIDRGRNNCRHFLMWISEDRAKELKARQ